MTRLQELREARGWSRNALCTLAKLSYGRVGQFESGRSVPPRDSVELVRLAGVLGLSPDRAGELLDPVDEGGDES